MKLIGLAASAQTSTFGLLSLFLLLACSSARALEYPVVPTAVQSALDSSNEQAADSSRFNILLIIADDLSANALGCYGNSTCQTPNIDALAKRGLLFERAYCQFPVCGPSRAAMMSGLYCQTIGVMGNGMSSEFTDNMGKRPSMSQFFKDRGWYSARVSKIYHMRVPGDITAGVSGPDHPASWHDVYNCQGPEWMSIGQHEHLTNEKLKRTPNKHYNLGFGGAFYSVRTKSPDGENQPDKLAADQAIKLLRSKKEDPFFLAVGLVRPHVPLVAPESFFEQYAAEQLKLPDVAKDDWLDIPKAGISKNSARIGLDSKTKKQKVLQAYYASVSYMDAQVGRILAELKRLNLDKKTIVLFKSDHGYHLGEHDFWQKMSLHEESTRIPLIVSVPEMARSGKTRGQSTTSLVEAIDLYPTLCEINGFAPPAHCQGKSLVDVMVDPSTSIRKAAFCTTGKARLLRTDRYAYIRYRDKSEELYDMLNDPEQFLNLAKSETHAAALKRLRIQLDEHLQNHPPIKRKPMKRKPMKQKPKKRQKQAS